jgi:hypothetical protein
MRGARECGYPVPAAIMADIARDIASDNHGLFVGYTEDGPRVVSVAFLPCNAFYLAATIGLAYSEKGPRQLVAAVGDRMREWLVGHGHHEAMVLNLFHTDRSYVRGLAHFGAPERIGSVIRFKF